MELAPAIRQIEKAMKDLTSSGLKREAIVILLTHSTKVGIRNIEKVLDGLESLGRTYLEVSDERG